jgi:hypothetical protein
MCGIEVFRSCQVNHALLFYFLTALGGGNVMKLCHLAKLAANVI